MTSFAFRKEQRLRRPADFERVYQLRCRSSDRFLLVFAAANQLPVTRLGLSVSRKQGGAVVRNYIKRRLREAFRLTQQEFPPGLDLIVIPKQGVRAGVAEYQASLRNAVRYLARRVSAAKPAAPEPQANTTPPT